tara:strand:- start:1202 stop:2089 length:888 start_codon:yes stop_codon:yes gene_type:complete
MASKKIIFVTGADGQLGKSIKKVVKVRDLKDFQFFFFSKSDLDISKEESFSLIKEKPDFFINCAAYTNVKEAESNKRECFSINSDSVKIIDSYCRSNNTTLIQISTDYVFDGTKKKPYLVHDSKNPLNTYGLSKSECEDYLINFSSSFKIVRTSWVYSEFGINFFKTILKKLLNSEEIILIDDQYGKPTYAVELANFLINLCIYSDHVANKSILHFSGNEKMSWLDFGKQIKEMYVQLGYETTSRILPIDSKSFQDSVQRPSYSVLSNSEVDFSYANIQHRDTSICIKSILPLSI